MIGIYKITSPSNRVYIGQTKSFNRRMNEYKRYKCKTQKRIYYSLKKHGVENHVFEFLEQCDIEQLNERERHYQDLYNVLSKKGLNCKLTATNEKTMVHSEESLRKISEASKGRVWDEERKKQWSEKFIGKSRSEETKQKISLKNKGNKHTEECKLRMSESKKGKKQSEETKRKISETMRGRHLSKKHINALQESKTKIILDVQTGIYYQGLKEVSELFEISYSTLKKRMYGILKNNTSFIFP